MGYNRIEENYRKWNESEALTPEEKKQLEEMTEEQKLEAFYKYAEFGTGGMRGIMGIGTNRMNRWTVRMAAVAYSDMLKRTVKETPITVIIAYDTRNGSVAFAEETAGVMAAAGIRVKLFDRYSPVPLLSYAVRKLGASGGVVLTASHNTREYNGFKAYDETGCQMLPDKTEIIGEMMESIENPFEIPCMSIDKAVESGMLEYIGDEVIDSFIDEICETGNRIRREIGETDCDGGSEDSEKATLKVVYTPLHGSGREYVTKVLARAGIKDVVPVEEQWEPDGDFPTVKKPNPEDPAALEMAAAKAISEGADIIIGTDPDCDRLGIGVVDRDSAGKSQVTYLTGNQTGVLFIDYLCRATGVQGKTLVTTIVTGNLGAEIAKASGLDVVYVLTGFKNIGNVMNAMEASGSLDRLLMGYEESYGYLVGTHARDKDGVSAALTACRMAAYHKKQGRTLTDALDEIYEKFGYWLDAQESIVFPGAAGEKTMKEVMAKFRYAKAGIFEPHVEFIDYSCDDTGIPAADVLKYHMADGSWVAVRPSGTEPKLKIYYCVHAGSKDEAEEKQRELAECIHGITGAYSS